MLGAADAQRQRGESEYRSERYGRELLVMLGILGMLFFGAIVGPAMRPVWVAAEHGTDLDLSLRWRHAAPDNGPLTGQVRRYVRGRQASDDQAPAFVRSALSPGRGAGAR